MKEHALERDRLELAAGDVLDVKAGLLLVMLIFLAGQAESVFQGSPNLPNRILAWVSILSLILGGVLAIVQLIPKKYSVLSSPIRYGKWLEDLRTHYSQEQDPEEKAVQLAEHTDIVQTVERVEANVALNKRKVLLVNLCFYCVSVSFAANMATLTLRHLFPSYR
jgi:hypothetical protein